MHLFLGHKISGCEAVQTNNNTFLIRLRLPITTTWTATDRIYMMSENYRETTVPRDRILCKKGRVKQTEML